MAKKPRSRSTGNTDDGDEDDNDDEGLVVHDTTELDEGLVDEAVEFIRTAVAETMQRGLATIGSYVFAKFFNSDPATVSSKAYKKNASFRLLTERCETVDFPVSRSFLHGAVAVASMNHQLLGRAEAYRQLPTSHQVALLPMREPMKIERLAVRALAKKISVRELRAIVREERAKESAEGPKRGRPPKPVVLTAIDRSLELFTTESGRRAFTRAQLDEIDEEDVEEAIRNAELLAESVEKLVAQLRSRGE